MSKPIAALIAVCSLSIALFFAATTPMIVLGESADPPIGFDGAPIYVWNHDGNEVYGDAGDVLLASSTLDSLEFNGAIVPSTWTFARSTFGAGQDIAIGVGPINANVITTTRLTGVVIADADFNNGGVGLPVKLFKDTNADGVFGNGDDVELATTSTDGWGDAIFYDVDFAPTIDLGLVYMLGDPTDFGEHFGTSGISIDGQVFGGLPD